MSGIRAAFNFFLRQSEIRARALNTALVLGLMLALPGAPGLAQVQTQAAKTSSTKNRVSQLCGGVAAPKGASATEQRVWRSLCAAGYADLSALDEARCDALGETPWSKQRRIGAGFLRRILIEAPWREALGGAAPHLRCALIEGDLDLSHLRLERTLLIEDSRIEGDVRLTGAFIHGVLSFRGSRVSGALDAEGIRVRGDFFLRGGGVEGMATFGSARLDGALEAQRTRFGRGLSLDQARIEGPVRLTGAELQAGAADFSALFAESLDLRNAGFAPGQALSLRGARLGALEVDGAALPNGLDFRGFHVASGDFLRGGGAKLAARLERGFPNRVGRDGFQEERASYRAMIGALQAAGDQAAAREVALAQTRRRLDTGEIVGLQGAAWRIWDALSGFGYLPDRLAFWAAGLTLLGAALGLMREPLRALGPFGLLRLSFFNAFLLPLDAESRESVAAAGPALSVAFAMQRILGGGILLLLLHVLAVRLSG